MKKSKLLIAGLIGLLMTVGLALAGCATATINSYTDPNFSAADVKSLAVFPLRNARFAPSDALQITREMTQAIYNKNPAIKIIGAAEAVEILNANGLAEKWADFQRNYAASGIPDGAILREVGAALGVDMILQGEILNIFQQDAASYQYATTRVTVHYAMMEVATNKTAWDATSDGIKKGARMSAPPIIEAVRLAQNKILGVLPF
jgi:hypothetical protein